MDFYLQKTLNFQIININEADIPSEIPEKKEFLLCYELNPEQTANIEPIPEKFLGNLLFIGKNREKTENIDNQVNLPEGHYLFIQKRSEKILDKTDWLYLAIEQQKDGLWERNKLGDTIYIRLLYEDKKTVTQIFRPVI